jgi:hypothetical protein
VVPELRQKPRKVFLPLSFEPGEMGQVDWGDILVNLVRKLTKLQLFAITLNYSGDHYFEVFERANQEAFFRGTPTHSISLAGFRTP